MNRKLICFIGTDGSGKSTASKMLMERYKLAGKKCRCIWGAYDGWLLRPLISVAKKLLMKHSSINQDYKSYRKDMNKVTKKRFLIKLYLGIILCEYWFEVFVKVRLPMMLGYDVICDRYVFDTVISISSNLGFSMQQFQDTLKRWSAPFPKPDIVVYVATPADVSVTRKDDIPDVDYLNRRIPYYEEIASTHSIIKINGTEPLAKIQTQMQGLYSNIGEK